MRSTRLLTRLAETTRVLSAAHARLQANPAEVEEAGPAAEWLLDNFHVVREQLQEVRSSLPRGYYRELPELRSGPLTGYPRVYEIAITLISHTEARLDHANVDLFLTSVQSVSPLSIGELWAVPSMLRLALIESVRRMTLRVVERLDESKAATRWAERILAAGTTGGPELRAALRALADSDPALTPNFIARLLQLLRQVDGASPPILWIEQWIREAGGAPEQAVADAAQRHALTHIMMSNSITSLRSLGRRDWREFVEQQSVAEAVLRTDPSGSYGRMTFATRDAYRHVVEQIAKRAGHRETSVAQWAVDLARRFEQQAGLPATSPRGHVGYYLVDEGLAELEHHAGYPPTVRQRMERLIRRHPSAVFHGAVGLSATVCAWVTASLLARHAPVAVLLAVFCVLPSAVDVAITVWKQVLASVVPPRVLARMDLHEHGVPWDARTAIVIPTLFASLQDVADALENLEVQFLANREPHIHFAVLSDFTDAAEETQPGDDAIMAAAAAEVRRLNARYAGGPSDAFHLLHRPRRWNAAQRAWMGWERKRGKLADFNRLVLDGDTSAFSLLCGDVTVFRDVRFVITLDADTVLPPDAAPSLIGAITHPLNRAVFDPEQPRVTRGYGILQPRVGISLPSAHRTRFAGISSGYPGVDPYATAASDLYQDLYGEGSFTGKGIYDVDAFERATRDRFPDDSVLSHDLLEGAFARSGLATDVMVYDDAPASYIGAAARKHRWIRGDWQLLPWLRPTAPRGSGGRMPNPLSWLSRWKVLDNLRRSLGEVALLLLIVGGWTVLPGAGVYWTLIAVGALGVPWVVVLIRALVQPPRDKSWRSYYAVVGRDAVVSGEQWLVALLFLPHHAWVSVDAIGRTLYRLAVSRRYLLEWQSASFAERSGNSHGRLWCSLRASAAAAGVAATVLSIVAARRQLALGLPLTGLTAEALVVWSIALAWMVAPHCAEVLSRPSAPRRRPLTPIERADAMRYAVAHWRYFDRFVSAETHWLAPDNFQSDPHPVVAMRTSPTNIGLQLLATVSACDLGLISALEMIERLAKTFETLDRLPRHRGHFFNWYDLRDLSVLGPRYVSTVDSGNLAGHLIAFRQACLEMAREHAGLRERLESLADQAHAIVSSMDFATLYDIQRKLFTIGCHPDLGASDDSYYDLLASEARLASFVAIAKNDVPVEHWFRLSRSLTRTSGATALVSWSGSMFEYLMPLLVMRSWPFTLIDETYRGALERQRAYAKLRDVPWGISESAYNVRDRQQTYQYHAFGVPDLALTRGLAKDLVIAPYASMLAALVDPAAGLANLKALEALGAFGEFGFCDALDYTRPPVGARYALVQAYMAHHVGMSLVALTNVLLGGRWQARFHADSLVRSSELLLHERVPRRFLLQPVQTTIVGGAASDVPGHAPVVRHVNTQQRRAPRVALLGTVPYTVMLNHNGSGYSQYEDIAVTRWRSDSTRDDTGQFCYLKDVGSGRAWSAAYQPLCVPADESSAHLGSDRVTWQRVDGDIETHTTVTVVPGDAAEVRSVTLSNHGAKARDIELTSYGEIVMTPAASDRAHKAFSNLSVETEWHAWCSAITARRRPRSPDEPSLWCVHVVDEGRDRLGVVTCETDRARFLGRGRSARDPVALENDGALSGSTGAVLDPIFALRTRVRVAPGQSVSVAFTTLVATSRSAAFALADRYHAPTAAQRARDFAWSAAENEGVELGISSGSAAVYQDLAAQFLYHGGSMAPPVDEVRRNRGAQPRLWVHRLSGDLPIVLATIESLDGLPTLRELFVAHGYWRRRGLTVDLVVLNGHRHDYLQELRDGIAEAMVAANDAGLLDQPGGVYVRRQDTFDADDLLMLTATARMHVSCDGRTLSRLLSHANKAAEEAAGIAADAATRTIGRSTPRVVPVVGSARERGRPLTSFPSLLTGPSTSAHSSLSRAPAGPTSVAREQLLFDNGIGGVDATGAYCMTIHDDQLPPAPWVNVVANPLGGFLVSERGTGCTWAENAHFFRLTPWYNDPVTDPSGDVLYIRDTESREVWSATPAPVSTDAPYRVRHSPGASTFEHNHDGIQSALTLGLAHDAAVKISLLRLTNSTGTTRRLTVTAYVEWTLGSRREETQQHVRTQFLAREGALLAQNHFDPSFAAWTAFLATSEPVSSHSADRCTFMGRDGTLAAPAALSHDTLDGSTGVALDPCGALQMQLVLEPGASRDITVLLGAAPTQAEALRAIARLQDRGPESAAKTRAEWTTRLGVVSVRTPDRSFDVMLNTWTLYQAVGCRMWARTGLYQSSGAFGFRDQLQDAMAMVYAEPELARAHILRAAARQFVEGDVQHWWHPHTGRGVRTRFSDDLAWLPYVVDHYVRVTGDATVLEEYAPFVTSPPLAPEEQERYELPLRTEEHGSVYEHCRRALRRACTVGLHGLPLIGSGDWNDGMSRVGAKGTGESVWLAWFLITTLRAFAVHAEARGDRSEAAFMRQQADAYLTAIETHGWDGSWYRRAYYDDGTPIGSSASDECRIDSIAQSWSVISGAAQEDRRRQAMDALYTQLVRTDARLIMLLTPPFDRGSHDPGYIKGYLPGVRENGAQYTHAGLWVAMATALMGDGDRAFALFQMLNPLTHSATVADMERYKVEPYAVAADVYTAPTQLGRGGWTWYTGSASWMYRVGLEHLLGFTKVGNTLRIRPRVPSTWPEYEISYRFGASQYDILVCEPGAIQRFGARVTVDGVRLAGDVITLIDDGAHRRVVVHALPASAT